VQAIVLIAALVFASRQVAVTRDVAERHRQRELIDRLVDAADRLYPEIHSYSAGLRKLVSAEKLLLTLHDVPENDPDGRFARWADSDREITLDETFRAQNALKLELRAVRRHLVSLGAGNRVTTYAIQVEGLRWARWMFHPSHQVRPEIPAIELSADRLGELTIELQMQVDVYVTSVIPLVE
jgi:hypothetical protein